MKDWLVTILSLAAIGYIVIWMYRSERGGGSERRVRRPAFDPLVEPSPVVPGIPQGWSIRDYVTDGLLQTQIMLIQQARRPGP